jgi:hypothetical protein
MTASFRSLIRNIIIIKRYAPTEIAEIETKMPSINYIEDGEKKEYQNNNG